MNIEKAKELLESALPKQPDCYGISSEIDSVFEIIKKVLAELEPAEPRGFTKKLRDFAELYSKELPRRAEITLILEAADEIDSLNAELGILKMGFKPAEPRWWAIL